MKQQKKLEKLFLLILTVRLPHDKGSKLVSSLKNKKNSFLPEEFAIAHELSFIIHDVMAQIIKSGEEGNFFTTTIDFENDDESESLKNSDDIFAWLEAENRFSDRAKVLKTSVLPAVLSDMLHCIYEALETSRKGKLSISYMLIRKPFQESLYLLESIVLDELDFSQKLAEDPLQLRSKNARGLNAHAKRIQKVLDILNESSRFDATYIAQLRYDKMREDSFDGICNHAMHLFTEHKAIRTEQLNINFIFSGWDQKISQWSYLYSRIPYLLFYTLQIVEYIVMSIAPTTQEYLDETQRRISASIVLWWKYIDENYKCPQLEIFVQATESWLNEHCQISGYAIPTEKDLWRMSKIGAYPKEKVLSVKKRNMRYKIHAAMNRMTAK